MNDPLNFLGTADAGSLLLITTAAALTWTRLFPQLNTKQAPCGIVSLQLAFTPGKAAAVIDSWRQHHLDGPAKRSQLTDLGFIVCYAWTLGLLASIATRAADTSGLLATQDARTAAAALAITGWTAGFLDIIEDSGLWLQLTGHLKPPLTAATATASTAKWFLALGSALASIALLIGSAA